jgi:hypothetical protein
MLSGISRKECFFFAKWTIWGASAGFPSRNSESAAHLFFSFLFVIADVHFQTDGADDRTLIRSPPFTGAEDPLVFGCALHDDQRPF